MIILNVWIPYFTCICNFPSPKVPNYLIIRQNAYHKASAVLQVPVFSNNRDGSCDGDDNHVLVVEPAPNFVRSFCFCSTNYSNIWPWASRVVVSRIDEKLVRSSGNFEKKEVETVLDDESFTRKKAIF